MEITDEEAQRVTGGNAAETQEIYDYLREHDPEMYEILMNARSVSWWALMRELYKRGVPVVAVGKTRSDNNIYYIGEWDHPENGKPISHEELMAMLREKI